MAKTPFQRYDRVAKLIKKFPDSCFVPKEFSFYARSQNCEERLLDSSCQSVRLSAWNNSVATRRTLIKFDIWVFSYILSRKFSFHLNRARMTGTFTNIHFWSYVAHFILEWETFQAKVLETIKTHILSSITFLIKSCLLWNMW